MARLPSWSRLSVRWLVRWSLPKKVPCMVPLTTSNVGPQLGYTGTRTKWHRLPWLCDYCPISITYVSPPSMLLARVFSADERKESMRVKSETIWPRENVVLTFWHHRVCTVQAWHRCCAAAVYCCCCCVVSFCCLRSCSPVSTSAVHAICYSLVAMAYERCSGHVTVVSLRQQN